MDNFYINNVTVKEGERDNLLGYVGKIVFENYSTILGALCLFAPHLFFLDWLYRACGPFLFFRAPFDQLSLVACLGLIGFFLLLTSGLIGVYMIGMLVTKHYVKKEGEFKELLKKVYKPPLLVFCKVLAWVLVCWVAVFILTKGFTWLMEGETNGDLLTKVLQWSSLLVIFAVLTRVHMHSDTFTWTVCVLYDLGLAEGQQNSLDVMKNYKKKIVKTHFLFSWPLFIVPVVLLLCSMVLGEDIEALVGGHLLAPFVLGGCVCVTIVVYGIANTFLLHQIG